MKLLILLHVLSAIIGIGPVFVTPVLLRQGQSALELRQALRIGHGIEIFPKVGGTIAVLSGLALVIFGNYGSILQLWLIGALVIYILIQIVVIGLAAPVGKRLAGALQTGSGDGPLSSEQTSLLAQLRTRHLIAIGLGVVLFIFMILKPGA